MESENGSGTRKSHFIIKIPYWLCGIGTLITLTSIVVGALACLVMFVTRAPKPDLQEWMDEVEDRVGKGGVNLFKSYDLNRDGYLSVYEFEPLIPHLKNLSSAIDEMMPMETYLEYSPKDGEGVSVVYANFTPLLLNTMTKEDILTSTWSDLGNKVLALFSRFTRYTLMPVVTGADTLSGLRDWKEPSRKQTMFGASEFKSLLPDDMENIPLGKPYNVLPYGGASSSKSQESGTLYSSRYFPPMPKGKEGVLFRVLGMMHPRPFLNMRFHPRGTVACVQAYNDEYVHVVFRMHAEYQLNEPPLHPFWFTPAQFLGELVMTLDGSHLHYFHMSVPSERRLNVDMEWMTGVVEGEESMEVDIGYMPLMEWTLKQPSQVGLTLQDALSTEPPGTLPLTPDLIHWTSEVSRHDVLRLIEIEFFPFKTVTYHNLTRAVQLSQQQNKPVHAIFLWGALDDQSC
ncbi:hypothetical protein ACOMHN_008301 [Nucella lapillus]